MSTSSDEEIPDLADPINTALVSFTGCLGEAFDDICTYSLTIGESYVPFSPDPDEDSEYCTDDNCSQLWVRVAVIQPIYVTDGFDMADCGGVLRLDLEVGIMRCLEIPEDGEAPSATEVMVAAMQSMSDMKKIHCAALSCEVWDSLATGTWTPTGPMGGQYGGVWTFSVEI